MENIYKVIVSGNGGAGKSVILTRLLGGGFEPKYKITVEPTSRYLWLETNYGSVCVELVDVAGQRVFDDGDEYHGADMVLICYSLCPHEMGKKGVPFWHKRAKRVAPSAPIYLVGTKADLGAHQVEGVYCVSSRYKTGTDTLVLGLARALTGKHDLVVYDK
jgi:small GTP-binding protein